MEQWGWVNNLFTQTAFKNLRGYASDIKTINQKQKNTLFMVFGEKFNLMGYLKLFI